jgi:hypothetical protein
VTNNKKFQLNYNVNNQLENYLQLASECNKTEWSINRSEFVPTESKLCNQ